LQLLELELERRAVLALRGEQLRRQLDDARDESPILGFEQARGLAENLGVLLALQIDHARAL